MSEMWQETFETLQLTEPFFLFAAFITENTGSCNVSAYVLTSEAGEGPTGENGPRVTVSKEALFAETEKLCLSSYVLDSPLSI